jgi:molybdopterin molybdotransferase
MIKTPSPSGALTSLEAALAALLEGVASVPSSTVPLTEALGFVAAEMRPVETPLPPANRAEIDGWAFRASDLAGASSYSPLHLAVPPAWVEAGQPLPSGCDCVLETGLVERAGPIFSALGEASPGQAVRRIGEDAAAGCAPVIARRVVTGSDLVLARSLGLETLSIRSPAVRVIDVSSDGKPGVSARMARERLDADGAQRLPIEMCPRDAGSIGKALEGSPVDLIVLVGGTGNGERDATVAALHEAGALIAHGIALRPGRTAAIGRLLGVPVIALPGLPGPALGSYLALAEPVVDRLCGRLPRRRIALPLARKIASAVGLAEIVLLRQELDHWMPLVVGDLTLDRIREADAWLTVPAGEEGYAPGTPVGALALHGWS